MRFKTETSSIYEVDSISNKIRRLEGVANPTPRQGPDGEWKEYLSLDNCNVGQQALITWNIIEGVAKCTQTSLIVELVVNSNELPTTLEEN